MVRIPDQTAVERTDRIFRKIPGLEAAEFIRYGVMHAIPTSTVPVCCCRPCRTKIIPALFFAGQITGVKALWNQRHRHPGRVKCRPFRCGQELLVLSPLTMIGALVLSSLLLRAEHFQPMNANFGILPAL
jgi:methylenetetrahydrofolate--tRNA-(uracil-5-)-methyltransferase